MALWELFSQLAWLIAMDQALRLVSNIHPVLTFVCTFSVCMYRREAQDGHPYTVPS